MSREAKIWFIRNAEALDLAGDHENKYSVLPGITAEGTRTALAMGEAIQRMTSGDWRSIDGVFQASSTRSVETARVVLGGAGYPHPIETIDAFNHTGRDTREVIDDMQEWVRSLDNGLYVAAVSRRAIAACVGSAFGWSDEVINNDQSLDGSGSEESGFIPTASLTEVVVDKGDISVTHLGVVAGKLFQLELQEAYSA